MRSALSCHCGCIRFGSVPTAPTAHPRRVQPNTASSLASREDLVDQPLSIHVSLANRFEMLLSQSPSCFDLSQANDTHAYHIAVNTRCLFKAWLLEQASIACDLTDEEKKQQTQRLYRTACRLQTLFACDASTPSAVEASPMEGAVGDAWNESNDQQRRSLASSGAAIALCWLDSDDIDAITPQQQLLLFDLTQHLDASGAAIAMDRLTIAYQPSHPARLEKNLQKVAQAWLREASLRHDQLRDATQQTAFLDQQVDQLTALFRIAEHCKSTRRLALVSQLMAADPECSEMLVRLQRRWLARSFGWLQRAAVGTSRRH